MIGQGVIKLWQKILLKSGSQGRGRTMLRFIIKSEVGSCDHAPQKGFVTLDLEVPELEQLLKKGYCSQYGYEQYHLEGVEILDSKPKDTAG